MRQIYASSICLSVNAKQISERSDRISLSPVSDCTEADEIALKQAVQPPAAATASTECKRATTNWTPLSRCCVTRHESHFSEHLHIDLQLITTASHIHLTRTELTSSASRFRAANLQRYRKQR